MQVADVHELPRIRTIPLGESLVRSHQRNWEMWDHLMLISQSPPVLSLHSIDLQPRRRRIDAVNRHLLFLTVIISLDLPILNIKLHQVALKMATPKEFKNILPLFNATYARNVSPAHTIFVHISELILMRGRLYAPSVEKPLLVSTTVNAMRVYILAKRNLSARVT